MTEHVPRDEISIALMQAVQGLAPKGSNRCVPANEFCNVVIEMIASVLVLGDVDTPEEVERLAQVFEDKLIAAMSRRTVGHA
jgi:hypothetical protein